MSQRKLGRHIGLLGLTLIGVVGIYMGRDSVMAQAENQVTNPESTPVPVLIEGNEPALTQEQLAQREAVYKQVGALFNRSGDLIYPIDQTVAKIQPLLKHPDSQVRQEAARFFQKMGPALSAEHVGVLVPLLDDSDNKVKIVAIYALAAIQTNAKSVVPTLQKMMDNPDLAFAAQWGLQNIDPPTRAKRLQELLQRLQSPPSQTPRYHAVLELGYMNPVEIQPQLRQLLNHADPLVRQDAESVLGAIGEYVRQRPKYRRD